MAEYDAKGIGPGIIDEQEYDGKPYRVFFAKEPYGVCFCFNRFNTSRTMVRRS